MEDMTVTAGAYNFRPVHAAMQRYVDGNVLPGISTAVLIGTDLVDVKCVGWADRRPEYHCGPTTYFAFFRLRN
jgi:hypothetical protein